MRLLIVALLAFSGGCGSREASGQADAPVPAGDIGFGDFSRFAAFDWIDTHAHLWSHNRIDDYVGYQARFGVRRMVLQSPPNAASLTGGKRPNTNAEAFLAKRLNPDRFYVFAGLDLTPLIAGGEAALSADLAAQVNELADAGADGIKLYFRSSIVEPLRGPPLFFEYLPSNPSLAPLFETATARRLPVLIHIDVAYQASGLTALLELYPDLTTIVAHLGFAGRDIGKLQAILAARPNAYLDVGHFVHSGELLREGDAARTFFITHGGRVFQSADFASGCQEWGLTDDTCPSEAMAVSQMWTLRAMLETRQQLTFRSVYTSSDVTVTGLGLPPETLQTMYRGAALAVLGEPKPVQCAPALRHIDRLIAHTSDVAELSRLQDVRARFSAACP